MVASALRRLIGIIGLIRRRRGFSSGGNKFTSAGGAANYRPANISSPLPPPSKVSTYFGCVAWSRGLAPSPTSPIVRLLMDGCMGVPAPLAIFWGGFKLWATMMSVSALGDFESVKFCESSRCFLWRGQVSSRKIDFFGWFFDGDKWNLWFLSVTLKMLFSYFNLKVVAFWSFSQDCFLHGLQPFTLNDVKKSIPPIKSNNCLLLSTKFQKCESVSVSNYKKRRSAVHLKWNNINKWRKER